ncbi:hypothetical protein ACW7G2_07850 [Luteimonas sp. A277]
MKSFMLALGFATAALVVSAGVLAGDVVVNTDAQAILQQQQEIRQEAVAREGRYKDLDERTHRELLDKQDTVFSLLEGRERSTELGERDQVALFNSLESISAIINQAEDERMVCERVRPTGSNRAQRVCKTVAQRRAEHEAAQRGADMSRNARCVTACGDTNRPEGW